MKGKYLYAQLDDVLSTTRTVFNHVFWLNVYWFYFIMHGYVFYFSNRKPTNNTIEFLTLSHFSFSPLIFMESADTINENDNMMQSTTQSIKLLLPLLRCCHYNHHCRSKHNIKRLIESNCNQLSTGEPLCAHAQTIIINNMKRVNEKK